MTDLSFSPSPLHLSLPSSFSFLLLYFLPDSLLHSLSLSLFSTCLPPPLSLSLLPPLLPPSLSSVFSITSLPSTGVTL